MPVSYQERAELIIEILPYVRKFNQQPMVVKIGGISALESSTLGQDLALLTAMGMKIIVVHGGGSQVSSISERLSIESKFVDGLRVTDAAAMQVVEMVLGGSVNSAITRSLLKQGVKAVGISGADGGLLQAKAIDPDKYGAVGEVTEVNAQLIDSLLSDGYTPVLAPYGVDAHQQAININADAAASAVAASVKACKLCMLTDVQGLLDSQGELISRLSISQAQALLSDQTISGGMIPKINASLQAISQGVESVHIIEGTKPHALLIELLTDGGIGTLLSDA